MATAPRAIPLRTSATPCREPPGVVSSIRSPLEMPSRPASSRLMLIGLCGCTWRRREAAIDIELIRLDLYEVIVNGHSCSLNISRIAVPSASRVGYQVGQPLKRDRKRVV